MHSFAGVKPLLIAFVIGLLGIQLLPAAAQQASVPIRAVIDTIDSNAIAFRDEVDGVSSVALDSATVIYASEPASLDDVSPGDFVATTAVKQADEKLHATELRIYPDALHGMGEGQRTTNDSDTIVTNATVSQVVRVPEGGQILKVKYHNGTAELIVDPQVPVTAVVWSDASALKPGMNVIVFAAKGQDGKVKAHAILAID
jgi:hypothetical protein